MDYTAVYYLTTLLLFCSKMQAKEFFAQYAVLPLSRRGGSEGAKKNNGGE